MRKIILGVFAVVLVTTGIRAQELAMPSLGQVYTGVSAQVKSSALSLRNSSRNFVRESKKNKSVSIKEFNLDYGGLEGRYWRLVPNPNPPGSGLKIYVDQGDHVRLNLSTLGLDDQTVFDIFDQAGTVDGKAVDHLEVYFFGSGPEQHTIEFDATALGIHLITSGAQPFGEVIVEKPVF